MGASAIMGSSLVRSCRAVIFRVSIGDWYYFEGKQQAMIAPAELEAVLVTHPDILDAAVTALVAKDEEVGEVPMAFVLKRQGSLLSEAAVIDYVAMQVAPYKEVRKLVFTHSIPRSAAGKILGWELRGLIFKI
ncbi:hypothetical protein RHMOL_Rhmol07G0177700 [Rhododendron molle]|uniref:Uncharacterized protein n=1 Tax=Rhododendron molle TaxID=49168 RepID=A0ACC0N1S9_RHOML|nr:hypothetical protein RHMOL_Rhmol07G0177700 [Rhododendron molle]